MTIVPGYAGCILRVDLTTGTITREEKDPAWLRKYLGGTGIGAALLYDEVPAGVAWSDPENRLVLASGPLSGTRLRGSSTYTVATLGPMTNGFAATQANGFFSALLKHTGFDALIFQGKAPHLSYLYLCDGVAELRDARHLAGEDTWETEDLIKAELGLKPASSSVIGIGPAGEHLVRFAGVIGDKGHAAAHNGVGAVMGSKNLKAVAVARGCGKVNVAHPEELLALAAEMTAKHHTDERFEAMFNWGTLHLFKPSAHTGRLPYRNYTTNVCPMTEEELETFGPEYLREHFDVIREHQCWGCQLHHCTLLRLPSGPLKGKEGEEPEFEGFTSMGSQLGVKDGMTALVLSNEIDRLGMDINETGWALGLALECYQKGLITTADTGGIPLVWGDVDAIREMYNMMARRHGFGAVLAEGAMRAAQAIGGVAPEFAVHTARGNTPLGHDHRSSWSMLFDIAVANTGCYELHLAPRAHLVGVKEPHPDSADDVAEFVSVAKWLTQFIDALGICRLANKEFVDLLTGLLNAATGWDYDFVEARRQGQRTLALMRAFNLRHGFDPEADRPSPRYGLIPTDGPHVGRDIAPLWDGMLDVYYRHLGWDRTTGKPLPETLKELDLENVVAELWGDAPSG